MRTVRLASMFALVIAAVWILSGCTLMKIPGTTTATTSPTATNVAPLPLPPAQPQTAVGGTQSAVQTPATAAPAPAVAPLPPVAQPQQSAGGSPQSAGGSPQSAVPTPNTAPPTPNTVPASPTWQQTIIEVDVQAERDAAQLDGGGTDAAYTAFLQASQAVRTAVWAGDQISAATALTQLAFAVLRLPQHVVSPVPVRPAVSAPTPTTDNRQPTTAPAPAPQLNDPLHGAPIQLPKEPAPVAPPAGLPPK